MDPDPSSIHNPHQVGTESEAMAPRAVLVRRHYRASGGDEHFLSFEVLVTYYSLLTTHYSLLTAHCSLLTTHYSLLSTHCSLLTAQLLNTTPYSLLIAH